MNRTRALELLDSLLDDKKDTVDAMQAMGNDSQPECDEAATEYAEMLEMKAWLEQRVLPEPRPMTKDEALEFVLLLGEEVELDLAINRQAEEGPDEMVQGERENRLFHLRSLWLYIAKAG